MERKRFVAIFALLVVLVSTGVMAVAFSNVRKGYAPRQPIAFSHLRMAGAPHWQVNDKGERLNTGGFGVPCLYCHTMAYKARHATVPCAHEVNNGKIDNLVVARESLQCTREVVQRDRAGVGGAKGIERVAKAVLPHDLVGAWALDIHEALVSDLAARFVVVEAIIIR